MSAKKDSRPASKSAGPCFIYGVSPWHKGEILILPASTVRWYAAYQLARLQSRTWGEFLDTIDERLARRILAEARRHVTYRSFAAYRAARLREAGEACGTVTRKQAMAEYRQLKWPAERPPLADDPYDHGRREYGSWGLSEDGATQEMNNTVSYSIFAKCGCSVGSMWEDLYFTFSMKKEDQIVAKCREEGYRITRHDGLIGAACGVVRTPLELQRQLLLKNLVDAPPDADGTTIAAEAVASSRVPPPPSPITEIAADPWLKDAKNRGPVPPDAVLLCGYLYDISGFGVSEMAYLQRTDAGDELWVRSDHKSGRMVVAPPQPAERDAALLLFEVLVRVRVGFSWPHDFTTPGLMTEADYLAIIDTVDGELTRYAEQARVSGDQSAIVVAARELSLSPEPSGEGPHHWRANCPGTQHSLMISSGSDQFGCGYCRVKGGPSELKAFVARRRSGEGV